MRDQHEHTFDGEVENIIIIINNNTNQILSNDKYPRNSTFQVYFKLDRQSF